MENNENYGLILKLLRKRAGLSVRELAKKSERGAGWISEIENGRGTARISTYEFDRLVEILGGAKERPMFKTWVALQKKSERADRPYEGAILKFLRTRKALSLREISTAVGVSVGHLSKLERGGVPITVDLRKRVMQACGYSPASFKNFSTDPVRSKIVPATLKLDILLRKLPPEQIEEIFSFAQTLTDSTGDSDEQQ